MKGLGSFMPKPVQKMLELKGKVGSVKNAAGAARMLAGSNDYFARLNAIRSLGGQASGAAGLPPISAMITKMAVTLLTDIHEGAMYDLKRGLSRFDQSRVDQLANRYRSKRTRLLQGGGEPIRSSNELTEITRQLSSELADLADVIDNQQAARAKAHKEYVAQRRLARRSQSGNNGRSVNRKGKGSGAISQRNCISIRGGRVTKDLINSCRGKMFVGIVQIDHRPGGAMYCDIYDYAPSGFQSVYDIKVFSCNANASCLSSIKSDMLSYAQRYSHVRGYSNCINNIR